MHVSRSERSPPQEGVRATSADRMFLSKQHKDALSGIAHVLGGPPRISTLTGEAGLGKTTLMTVAVADWPAPVRIVRGASLTVLSALAALSHGAVGMTHPILVIDDAHEMQQDTLEHLGNLAGSPSLPHIVLVGQTVLWSRLREPGLARLSEAIAHRAILFPLPYAEAEEYLRHVFRLVGASAKGILAERVQHDVLLTARGNMRRLNAALSAALPTGGVASMQGAGTRAQWKTALPAAGGAGLAIAVIALTLLAIEMPEMSPGRLWPVVEAGTAAAPPGRLAANPTMPAAPPQETEAPRVAAAPPGPLPNEVQEDSPTALPAEQRATVLAMPAEPEPARTNTPAVQEIPAVETAVQVAGTVVAPAPPQALPGPPPILPAAPSVTLVAPTVAAPMLSDEVVAGLLRRGDVFLGLHDIAGARRFYQLAATEGRGALRARAAVALAATFDPAQMTSSPWGPVGDRAAALAWYRLAASLGNEDAKMSVARLVEERP